MMRAISRTILFAVAVAVCSPALAQDEPGPDEIGAALNLDLPGWWQVANVEIQASVNDGDDISPHYRQRFVADLATREDLFRLVDEVHPFTVISGAAVIGDTHRLYGVATSALEMGAWSTGIDLENSVRGLGMPRSMFEGPVVIAGTEASQQAINAYIEGQEVSMALAEHAARVAASAEILSALEAQAAAQERALIEDIRQRRLEAMKGRLETDLGAIDTAIDELIAANRQSLEELALMREQRIAAATAHADTLIAIEETQGGDCGPGRTGDSPRRTFRKGCNGRRSLRPRPCRHGLRPARNGWTHCGPALPRMTNPNRCQHSNRPLRPRTGTCAGLPSLQHSGRARTTCRGRRLAAYLAETSSTEHRRQHVWIGWGRDIPANAQHHRINREFVCRGVDDTRLVVCRQSNRRHSGRRPDT